MSTLFNIKNKIIILSGATGVLGSAMAKYLAAEGAKVIVLGRNSEKVNAIVEDIIKENGSAYGVIGDATNEQQLLEVRVELEDKFGKLDVLINAAGGNLPGAVIMPDQNIMDSDTEALQKVMELNYLGTFIPTKVFMPLFLHDKAGSIINISSMAASIPMTRVMGYSSSKAAIDNLTKWLSTEFAHKYGEGIRVNAIAPGFFLTAQNKNLLTETNGSLSRRGQQVIDNTPMGRFGKPEELFGVLHWLCSDASKFVTGTIVPVDGGFSAYAGV